MDKFPTTKEEIEHMLSEYPLFENKDLFRTALEYLVALAQREQLILTKNIYLP